MRHTLACAIAGLALVFGAQSAFADGGSCPRPAVGSEVLPPPDLYSQNGKLEASLNYFTSMDDAGRTLFCFVTTDGKEGPTFHVNPGDTLTIHLTNQIPAAPLSPVEMASSDDKVCGNPTMTLSSVNMHFHGVNASPKCHSDEVIRTLVNSGETFDYTIKFPTDEPPGLYWYHPHVHGISSQAVQGGATGLIEVEGIANLQPVVAGLPERFLILRDEQVIGKVGKDTAQPAPFWDASINYVTVPFPSYTPAIIKMQRGTQEFWRVGNAAANTIMDIELVYDGVAQPLQIVGLDGVPTGSQDGKRQGTIITQRDILLAPGNRAEFIVTAPGKSVTSAIFRTKSIDGGPASDVNPARPFAIVQTSDSPRKLPRTAERSGPPNPQRFEKLIDAKVTAKRLLYFLEIPSRLKQGAKAGDHRSAAPPSADPVKFYITVDGQMNRLFDPNEPPAIVTKKGAVEEWTIQNRTPEVHEFHMHQLHFLVEEVSGVKIPKDQQQFYDTFQVPYYIGSGDYPYIKARMDFRGAVAGDFVYHCHILDHEDGGMMAIIRVKG